MNLRNRLARLERDVDCAGDASVAAAVREALKYPDYLEYLERLAMNEDEAMSRRDRIQRLEQDTRGAMSPREPSPAKLTPEQFRALPLEERIRLLRKEPSKSGPLGSAAPDDFRAIPLEERIRMLSDERAENGRQWQE